MSQRRRSSIAAQRRASVVFAALSDETRLSLVVRLSGGEPHSISELTSGSRLTRQAMTKHLRVLERAGIVHAARSGRESRFAFEPGSLEPVRKYIDLVSEQWDESLSRLKSFVEN
jgi:DNA-binding transcriptional ArsR family regulator